MDVTQNYDAALPIERSSKGRFCWKFWKSRRHIVTLMGIWGFFNVYTVRGNLSVAIVAMTEIVNVTLENGTVVQQQEFAWDSRERGLVLGSFFYGYVCTQLIGGILAAKFGGNIVFGCGIGICNVLSILTVCGAKLGIYPLVALRTLMGLFQGVAFSGIQDVYLQWSPQCELSTMAGLAQSGCQIGIFTSFLLSGFFVEYFGWESVFYIFGGFGCLWFVLWMIYIKRDPARDPRISIEEKVYIESGQEEKIRLKLANIPWKMILTSKAVWAHTVVNSCDSFATFTYLTQIPTYLNDVLNYNLGATGFFSAAPFLLFIILTPLASGLSDYLRSSNILSTTNVRKLCMSSGFLLGAICLVIMSDSEDMTTIWACLIVAVGMSTFIKTSYFANPVDFASIYASIVYGFSSTFAITQGVVAPTVAGFIVRNGTPDEWKLVFYITSGFALLGMIFFAFFGQGEIQEWAKRKPSDIDTTCLEPLQV